jgi:Na+/pantothenate symporter
MALTVLVVPMYAPYNQVLLLPAVLAVIRDRTFFVARSRGFRLGYGMGGFVLAWQWIASLGLSVVFLRGATAWALSGWKWPFLATFATPVLVFAMILVDVRGRQHGAQV